MWLVKSLSIRLDNIRRIPCKEDGGDGAGGEKWRREPRL